MNLLKELQKISESLSKDIQIIPDDKKDAHTAKQLSNMMNYIRKNKVDAMYFCCDGHQFNTEGLCPYCIEGNKNESNN